MTRRPTEDRNPATVDIDLLSSEEALTLIVREDARAVEAVLDALPALAILVNGARDRLAAGGTLHYFGAGASGRLAILDATELNPTYGFDRDRAVAHFPGGPSAFANSSIDLEDAVDAGRLDAARVAAGDIAVGVTASGTTPYVEGALRTARAAGALTGLVTNSPASPLGELADVLVALDTGSEAIMGSTRMKAGTATKVALNAFSTAVMVGLGRTYSNLMIDMVATNRKLHERAVLILHEATGAPDERCLNVLTAADGDVPVALVALLTDVDVETAARVLKREGTVRRAVANS